MQYFDPEVGADLQVAFESLVESWPDVTRHTMFGCPSFKAGETLFAVLVTDGVVLTRLTPEEKAAVEADFEAGPFEAGTRTIGKWVQVHVAHPSVLDDLQPYVKASYETARVETD